MRVVSFASEAGPAGLIELRYQPGDPVGIPDDFVFGWTEIDDGTEQVPDPDDGTIPSHVDEWLETMRALPAAIGSRVLPEADVIHLNPAHPDAAHAPSLTTRLFGFAECLHVPPMLARFRSMP